MKRNLSLILITVLFASCSEMGRIADATVETEEISKVSFVLPAIEYDDEDLDTKVTVSREPDGTHYLWNSTDVVGIFPREGCQLYFSLKDGVGSETVTFDGGGWAMKSDAEYFSYLPFIEDFYIDKTQIPMSYIGQKQIGNATETLGNVDNYLYLACKGVLSADAKSISFVYKQLGLLHRIIIPVVEGTYESLILDAGSDCIAYEGTFNGIDIDQKIYNPKYADKLSIELEDVTFDSPSTLYVYMMTSPFQNLGGQISLKVNKTDGTSILASTIGKNYKPGATKQEPNFVLYPSEAVIPGEGGSVALQIITSKSTAYTVSTDADWLTLGSNPTSGSAVVNVTAGKGTSKERTGHVIVSEDVTYNGTTITLQNKVKITQDLVGMSINIGGWVNDGNDYGGVAQ